MEPDLIWPNAESAVNSDPWLIAHHDRIRVMQPRVLVVNFVHGLAESAARGKVRWLCAALRESSRWQGFRAPEAPPFLDYRMGGLQVAVARRRVAGVEARRPRLLGLRHS